MIARVNSLFAFSNEVKKVGTKSLSLRKCLSAGFAPAAEASRSRGKWWIMGMRSAEGAAKGLPHMGVEKSA